MAAADRAASHSVLSSPTAADPSSMPISRNGLPGAGGEQFGEFSTGKDSSVEEHVELSLDEDMVDGEDDAGGGGHTCAVGVDVPAGGNANMDPCEGMEFGSVEEAFLFYNAYAARVGFRVTKRSSRRSKRTDEFIEAKFVCSRYGRKIERANVAFTRKTEKVECKAALYVRKREDDGRWYVYVFVKEHNHELMKAQARPRSKKRINSSSKNNIDSSNELDEEQHLALEVEDAQAMLEHFIRMQEVNPNFFYALDLNEEQRLRNVFWVDAKGRHDYASFGDVVSLDTTYVKNKYRMPFAPFVGVNHHGQFTIFGCALILDETVSTFAWLMKAWLRAMGGQAPKVIITDQDKAMKEAVAQVFPNSQHRFCLWHITRKIPEKLGHVIQQHKIFMVKFNKCIYRSWTDEEFERRWGKLIAKFEIGQDEWLESLYEDRRLWVPIYMRDTFFAGMSTPQRSDILNSFFDKYISRRTSLKEFLERYELALHDRYEKEFIADIESWKTKPSLMSPSPYESQLSSLYTREIFSKFQVEVMGTRACSVTKEREDGAVVTFRVNDLEEKQEFKVAWNEAESSVSKIPSQYILKRWTKDAKCNPALLQNPNVEQSRVQRYNDLCRRAISIAEEGSLSQESYDVALSVLEEGKQKCMAANANVSYRRCKSQVTENVWSSHY